MSPVEQDKSETSEKDAEGSADRGRRARRSAVPPHLEGLERPDSYLANLKHDLPAAVVVFLVALPLCLGIAVASGAPPLAGLITGIIGGTVVAWASGSNTAVSGPAAGLTVIVLDGIRTLGYEGFLLAVVAAGVMQMVFGFARAGIFAYYFPSAVIKGMLAAIGIILIIKQIQHALGFDEDFEGDLSLFQPVTVQAPGGGTMELGLIDQLVYAFGHIHWGAVVICGIGLGILILWSKVAWLKKLTWLPGPLLVVMLGVGLNAFFQEMMPAWALGPGHLVSLPSGGMSELAAAMSFPDFSRIWDPALHMVAFTIAAVASIETLLCVEALDKLDPFKRSSPTNRELVAQGVGNITAGMVGGIPMTAVIVRGSTNIQAGNRTRMSSFVHGLLLLAAVVAIPFVMNLIPLAALAAILLHVGYKLADARVFAAMFKKRSELWVPFVVTVIAIVVTDLLMGVGIGMLVALFFILRANLRTSYFIHRREARSQDDRSHIKIELSENVSFLNKASVNKVLHELPRDSVVEIDGSRSQHIHADVLELLHEFEQTAHTRGIEVFFTGIPEANGQPLGAH